MAKKQKTNPIPKLVGIFISLVLLIFLFLMLSLAGRLKGTKSAQATAVNGRPIVILDAGHGGFDGGAVAPDGAAEADLNLAYVKTLKPLLEVFGFQVKLTRSDSNGTEDKTAKTVHEKKQSDLQNRLALCRANPDAIFISIHQNNSPYHSAWGSVVYYSENHAGSKVLAESLQANFISYLQPENKRTVVSGKQDLFLLREAVCPAVLVECGFLSNTADYAKLKDSTYRKAFCLVLAQTLSEEWQTIWAEPVSEAEKIT